MQMQSSEAKRCRGHDGQIVKRSLRGLWDVCKIAKPKKEWILFGPSHVVALSGFLVLIRALITFYSISKSLVAFSEVVTTWKGSVLDWNPSLVHAQAFETCSDFKLGLKRRPLTSSCWDIKGRSIKWLRKARACFFGQSPLSSNWSWKLCQSFLPLGLKRRKFTLFLVTRRYTLLHLRRGFWFFFKIALFENLSRKNLSWSKILKMQLLFRIVRFD